MPSRISAPPTAAAVVGAPSAPAPASAEDTSITLTFNGVSFRLTPADQASSIANDDEANMISFLQGLTGSGSSAQLSLKNFTGTLQVELAATTKTGTSSAATATIATSSPITTSSSSANINNAAGGASRVSPESTAANKASGSTNAAVADEPSSILGHNSADDGKSPAHNTPQRARTAGTSGSTAAKGKTKQQGLLPFASVSTASSTAGAKKKTNNSKSDAKSAIAKARAGGGGSKSKVRYIHDIFTEVSCTFEHNYSLFNITHPFLNP